MNPHSAKRFHTHQGERERACGGPAYAKVLQGRFNFRSLIYWEWSFSKQTQNTAAMSAGNPASVNSHDWGLTCWGPSVWQEQDSPICYHFHQRYCWWNTSWGARCWWNYVSILCPCLSTITSILEEVIIFINSIVQFFSDFFPQCTT